MVPRSQLRRWAIAWILLSSAFAVHVFDEAYNDFLSVYNPVAKRLDEILPFNFLPVFSFHVWLTVLVVAVSILFLLTALIMRGVRVMRFLSYIFALVMVGNGSLHIAASLSMGKLMPGVYSSPFLLAGGIYLLTCVPRHS